MIEAWKEIEILKLIDKLIEWIRANYQAAAKENTYVAPKMQKLKG
ncbi:Uncharacterised protein [Orientia tsutsugamushi]|nr:Uncharacterised protein [Orientia tsutsugamushi]